MWFLLRTKRVQNTNLETKQRLDQTNSLSFFWLLLVCDYYLSIFIFNTLLFQKVTATEKLLSFLKTKQNPQIVSIEKRDKTPKDQSSKSFQKPFERLLFSFRLFSLSMFPQIFLLSFLFVCFLSMKMSPSYNRWKGCVNGKLIRALRIRDRRDKSLSISLW